MKDDCMYVSPRGTPTINNSRGKILLVLRLLKRLYLGCFKILRRHCGMMEV